MDRSALISSGFTPRTYPDQDGEFLRIDSVLSKFLKWVSRMDLDESDNDMQVIVEICPNNNVQIFVPDLDYFDIFPMASNEGKDLVNEAIATLADG